MFFGLWYIGLIEAACGEIESTSKGSENKKCIQKSVSKMQKVMKPQQSKHIKMVVQQNSLLGL